MRATAGTRAMLNWLVGNCDIFGLHAQNWMLLIGALFALYIAWLAVTRRPV
jgi:ABC-type sugar transport system substrate-binding protein